MTLPVSVAIGQQAQPGFGQPKKLGSSWDPARRKLRALIRLPSIPGRLYASTMDLGGLPHYKHQRHSLWCLLKMKDANVRHQNHCQHRILMCEKGKKEIIIIISSNVATFLGIVSRNPYGVKMPPNKQSLKYTFFLKKCRCFPMQTKIVTLCKCQVRERRRETMPRTCVAVNEERFTLIVATCSYVNPKQAYREDTNLVTTFPWCCRCVVAAAAASATVVGVLSQTKAEAVGRRKSSSRRGEEGGGGGQRVECSWPERARHHST
jgi:hypothetical protein